MHKNCLFSRVIALAAAVGFVGCGDSITNNYYPHHNTDVASTADASESTADTGSQANNADAVADTAARPEDYQALPNLVLAHLAVAFHESDEDYQTTTAFINVTVHNNGFSDAPESMLKLQYPGTPGFDLYPISIPKRVSREMRFSAKADLGTIVEFMAIVDADRKVLEIHEDDNERCVDLYNNDCPPGGDYSKLADLIFDDGARVPARLDENNVLQYYVTPWNAGFRPTYTPFSVTVDVEAEIAYDNCADRNHRYDEFNEVRTYSIAPPLLPNQGALFEDSVSLADFFRIESELHPGCEIGEANISVGAKVDAQHEVVEANETNNSAVTYLDVTPGN